MPTPQRSPRAAFWAAAIFTLIAPGVNARAQTPCADVPVKEVVLFSSGVGYFQHEGTVHGDSSTELRFKTTQINDILKSLVLNDLDGGHVGVVTYPSQDPLEKTLSSFQIDISDNPSEGQLLDKLRGARISLGYGGANGVETLTGTVLGVEQRDVPGGKDASVLKKDFLNLVGEHGIRSLELDKVDHFQMEDRSLQEELGRALAAVAGARDRDKKPVDIRFNGQGDRRVRLGYVVETPIWKASYRLVLPDKDAAEKKAVLQGWAIVENQTDNDWKDVRLSLVSGRPISFIQDLYQPLYIPRPTVVPELYASLRPQAYEDGERAKELSTDVINASNSPVATTAPAPAVSSQKDLDLRRDFNKKHSQMQPASRSSGLEQPSAGEEIPLNVSQSVTPLSDTAKIGELFQYTVGDVTLARQKSAMIPIINDPVETEKVSIYNQSVLATHPLNGARLKNTTADKKHLLQGPITVFDGGRYAGDARIDDVPPGQSRLLSYGVDLETSVIAKDLEGTQSIQTGKIVKGVLRLTRKLVSAKEYSTENNGESLRTLVIEHPVRAGWKLADTPAPVETTEKLYRFQQPVPAGQTEKFTVREESIQEEAIALGGQDLRSLQVYQRSGEIPAPVRDALVKVITQQQALRGTQQQLAQRQADINALSADQGRIRENIKSVDRTSGYASRLLKKLDDQESQLEKLHADADALTARAEAQQKEMNDSLNNLTVE